MRSVLSRSDCRSESSSRSKGSVSVLKGRPDRDAISIKEEFVNNRKNIIDYPRYSDKEISRGIVQEKIDKKEFEKRQHLRRVKKLFMNSKKEFVN